LEEINSEHELSKRLLEAHFEHSMKEGKLLLTLKKLLSPEEFEQWLQWNGAVEESEVERCIALSKGEKVRISLTVEKEVGNEKH
jgi:hypothetical protein